MRTPGTEKGSGGVGGGGGRGENVAFSSENCTFLSLLSIIFLLFSFPRINPKNIP